MLRKAELCISYSLPNIEQNLIMKNKTIEEFYLKWTFDICFRHLALLRKFDMI